MKVSKKSKIITGILAVLLFIIGLYTYRYFLLWSLPKISGVKYLNTNLTGQFNRLLGFALSLAIMPVAFLITWTGTPIKSQVNKIINVIIVVASILATVTFSRIWLIQKNKFYFADFPKSLDNTVNINVPISYFDLTPYILAGTVIGTAISYFILRQNKTLS